MSTGYVETRVDIGAYNVGGCRTIISSLAPLKYLRALNVTVTALLGVLLFAAHPTNAPPWYAISPLTPEGRVVDGIAGGIVGGTTVVGGIGVVAGGMILVVGGLVVTGAVGVVQELLIAFRVLGSAAP